MRMRILSAHRILLWSGQDRFLYKRFIALWIQFLLATSMDSECPTPNVQPTLDNGATPSAEACDQTAATAPSRASECTEARDRKLARDRARRRERLASETAEEKERRLSQRRVRDQARRAASRPSAHSEKRLEQMRSTERQRRAVESQDQRETRLIRNRLSQQQRLEAETPEERETANSSDWRLKHRRRGRHVLLRIDSANSTDWRLKHQRREQLDCKTCVLVSRSGLPQRQQPGISMTGRLTPTYHLLPLHSLFSTSQLSKPG